LYQGESLEMTVSQAANFSGEQQVDTAGKKAVQRQAGDNWALGKPQSVSLWDIGVDLQWTRKECQTTRVAMTDGEVVDAADVVDDERGKKGRKATSDAGLMKSEIFSPWWKRLPKFQTNSCHSQPGLWKNELLTPDSRDSKLF
jgi:hypothetical protein